MNGIISKLIIATTTLLLVVLAGCNPTPPADDSIYFVHSDHLNVPTVVTDKDKAIVWEGHRKPFGETEVTVATIEQPFRFPGQYYDNETGLHYNLMRDYDPRLGRYVQSDPIGLAGGISTYAYVGGNPLIFTDFMGLEPSPLPPERRRTRDCNSAEYSACSQICAGKGVESCKIPQTWRITRYKDGLAVWGWHDGPMSCSCNEPEESFCANNAGTCTFIIGLGICGIILTPWPDDLLIPVLIGGGAAAQ